MDVDKSLQDIISDKKKSSAPSSRGPQRPRQPASNNTGSARRETPYARPPPRSADDKWVHDAYQGPGAGAGRRSHGGDTRATALGGTAIGFTGLSPRIEVTNIHYEVTPADLKGIFSQAGTLVQGPNIRYDRSGRSTGVATFEYASPQQAKVAINKFDGAMTKGQTISIRLLPPARAAPQHVAPAVNQPQTGVSLLARIGGGAAGRPNDVAARGRGGAVRGARGQNNGPRGRGGAAAGRGRPAKRGPPTAGDLDKELDSFMKTDDDVAMA